MSFHMRMKLALGSYLVMGAVSIVVGVTYFTAKQFMPYHAQAVGTPWQEVDTGVQTLILALMKVAGGGWFVLGFLTIILALAEFRTRSAVARWTLPMATLIFYSASLAATWGVYQETGAATPWELSLAMIGFALLALVIDAPWSSRVPDLNIET
jgi:hypothetical protein